MKKKTIKRSTKYIIAICIVLLAVTIGIAVLLNINLKKHVKEMVYQTMTNVSETTAAFIDSETFVSVSETTTKEDDNYKSVINVLNKIKENNDFVYIYTIKSTEEGEYIFVIDQDPDEPAPYGYKVSYTDAMAECFEKGITTIDRDATADEWGKHYSTFSPIKDNTGKIVGAVGIDFDSIWYENQISRHSIYFILLFIVALASGVGISLLLMSQLLKKFRSLNKGLSSLSKDIDSLTKEINSKHEEELEETEEVTPNEGVESEIEEINIKMSSMERELKKYIEYVQLQTYTDTMTGVSSKLAYYNYLKELQKKIDDNTAKFIVIVFDLNGLKKINDNFGHECGDDFITNSASVIMKLFGKDHTFRIGGDEFIVIMEGKEYKIEELDEMILRAIDEFNFNKPKESIPVSMSFGASYFRPNANDTFKKVFKRADEIMYQYKGEFYKKYGDRRKN